MSAVREEVLAALEAMGVAYRCREHAPVEHMEDCLPNAQALGAVMPKNLFLTPRSEKTFVLAVVPAQAAFRTSEVSRQLGTARLSFASAERLEELLRTKPGAISPLGLLFDKERRVRLAMARSLREEPVLAFHPCTPDATLAFAAEDFFRFVRALGREIQWIDVP